MADPSFSDVSGIAQLAGVLLSFFSIYRKLRAVHRDVKGLAARVAKLEQWQAQLLKAGSGALVALALIVAAPAQALQQVSFSPGGAQSIAVNPYTLYSGVYIYGLRVRCFAGVNGTGGYNPITLEVTLPGGAVQPIVISDDSVYVVQTQKIRVLKVSNTTVDDNNTAFLVDLFQAPGEVANISPTPSPPDQGGPYPRIEDPDVIVAAATAAPSICEIGGIAVSPPAVFRWGRPIKTIFDTQPVAGQIIGRYVLVELLGRNTTDDADANFTGGKIKVYFRASEANGVPWFHVSDLDHTLSTGEATDAFNLTLNTVGWYCFVPSGVTGAAKVRIKRRFSLEALPR